MPDPASAALRAPILSAKGICMAFDSVDVLKTVSYTHLTLPTSDLV